LGGGLSRRVNATNPGNRGALPMPDDGDAAWDVAAPMCCDYSIRVAQRQPASGPRLAGLLKILGGGCSWAGVNAANFAAANRAEFHPQSLWRDGHFDPPGDPTSGP